MKRLALILLLMLASAASVRADAVDDLLKQAQTAAAAQKFDDALAAYELVITGHPEAIDRWFRAQEGIATALAAKGDLDGATKAAHVAMDGAPNWQSYDEAVTLAGNLLSALDKSVDRANQFLIYQLKGPEGGGTNPMEAIGYPSMPAREQAFATLRQKAGDNAEAARLRAYTLLYSGKPREALAHFADAFRRSSNGHEWERSGTDLVTVGLRAARGYRVGLEIAAAFEIHGTNRSDGKPGAPDPFAEFLHDTPAPGNGGLAELPPDDLAALRQVRDAAQLCAGDPQLQQDMRRAALAALQRANEALDAWGENGQEDWYLKRALQLDEPGVDELLFAGAQSAARGRALSFGGVYAMWKQIDDYCAAHNLKATTGSDPENRNLNFALNGLGGVRRDFNLTIAALERMQFPAPFYRTLTTPASFEPHK